MVDKDLAIAPFVSVIIACHNQGRYLSEAVESIFAQTAGYVECLIVNDGSSDSTEQVSDVLVSKYGDKKVRVLKHPRGENRGVSESRNLALRYASGEFIALLDADDAWVPNKLERQLQVLAECPDVGLVFSKILNVSDPGSVSRMRVQDGLNSRLDDGIEDMDVPMSMTRTLIQGNVIGSPTPLVRRALFTDLKFETGPESVRRRIQFEDWLMWLKLSVRTKFYCISEPLALYRIHDNQHTQSFSGRKRVVDLIWGTYEVFLLFLSDRKTALQADLGVWNDLAKSTLRARMWRHVPNLSWTEIIEIRGPSLWAHTFLAILMNYSRRRLRDLTRLVLRLG